MQVATGRCDHCWVASSHVHVSRGSDDLEFCGHHYRRHEIALISIGYRVVRDTRDSLTIKIESSS